jgi:hypothetical protein
VAGSRRAPSHRTRKRKLVAKAELADLYGTRRHGRKRWRRRSRSREKARDSRAGVERR